MQAYFNPTRINVKDKLQGINNPYGSCNEQCPSTVFRYVFFFNFLIYKIFNNVKVFGNLAGINQGLGRNNKKK